MYVNPSSLQTAVQVAQDAPWWAQLAVTMTPVIIGAVVAKKSNTRKRAVVGDVPPSVAQVKEKGARKR